MLELAYLMDVGGCYSRECVVFRGGGALGGCGGYGLRGDVWCRQGSGQGE